MIKEVEVFPLTGHVNQWVKDRYGTEFSADAHGAVYKTIESRPYPKFVGEWYYHKNAIVVILSADETTDQKAK